MLALHNLYHIRYYAKFLFLLHTDHVHYQYFHPVEDRPGNLHNLIYRGTSLPALHRGTIVPTTYRGTTVLP